VPRNVAKLVTNKPKKGQGPDILEHVWTAEEAGAFLTAAKAAGPQPAAFYTLALDSGARKGEMAALRWADCDLENGRLTIQRQLLHGGCQPVFGPTKTKTVRTIELAAETVRLLAAHKKHQAEIKLRNRQQYVELGLIFAKEWGGPARSSGIARAPPAGQYHRAAGVRPAHQGGRRAPHQVPWAASHGGDPDALGRRPGARRPAAPGPLED